MNIAEELKKILGPELVTTDKEELLCYMFNAGGYPAVDQPPVAVVFPRNAEEVSAVIRFAATHVIPVVTRAQGTGLNQGAVPVGPECIVLSTKNLKGINIDTKSVTATVGAGEINADIKKAAARFGLFYPPDPSSFKYSSIGGNVAENAGGLQCVKYGTTKDYVLGLEVVLPSGEIIHTGSKCVKDTAGYNITQLFVGAEGTLGVVTKVILKLQPLPEAKRTMLAVFDDKNVAACSVSSIMTAGVVPAIMEYMDSIFVRGVEEYTGAGLPTDADALLLMEVDGDEVALDDQVEKIRNVCMALGARDFKVARTAEEAELFWTARRAALPALARVAKGRFGGDPAVPVDRLADIIAALERIGNEHGVKTCCTGHAGDGNIHPNFFFDSEEEKARAAKARTAFHMEILAMGGTVSAEHGIGRIKKDYLEKQLGKTQYELMQAIKRTIDPDNIMNPGAVLKED